MEQEPSVSEAATTRIFELQSDAKALAREYYDLTGRPLGITAEIAEYEAARLLGVSLAPVRQAGYDAIRFRAGKEEKLQIKGRCLPATAKPGQRVGGIRLDREWDRVLLVLLEERFEATAIYEAGRVEVARALGGPGSRARNERGQLSVSNFKAIGMRIWPAP
ncbi:MAG: hypothetical protein M0Z82_17450 [Actinomycetota bacterium]|nr:hypothetical protein [Actinomycetota bacterium]